MADKGNGNGPSDRQNVIEAVLWLAFAAGAFWMTAGFDRPLPIYRLGPAFWPRILLIGIVIAAFGVLLGTYLKRYQRQAEANAPAAATPLDAEPLAETAPVTAKLIAVIGLPLVYVYLIHKFGFYLVTPFFLAGYMYLLGLRNWIKLAAVTVGLYALLVIIFVKLVYTPLPQGAGFFYTLNGQFISLIE